MLTVGDPRGEDIKSHLKPGCLVPRVGGEGALSLTAIITPDVLYYIGGQGRAHAVSGHY